MSTSAPGDPLLDHEDRPWSGGQKIAVAGVCLIALVACLWVFTGNINLIGWLFSHEEKPIQQNAVSKDNNAPPPQNPPTEKHQVDYSGRGGQQRGGVDHRLAIAAAGIGMTGMGGASASPYPHPPPPDPSADRPLPEPSKLEQSLTPTKFTGTRVTELPSPTYLIEQGRVLQCHNQTMVDSTLEGGVTAELFDVRGETGNVVLLDKGAKMFGTIEHSLMNGSDKLSVLWQNIRTPVLRDDQGLPHQYSVDLDSPATEPLGDTGMAGNVNRHLPLKIGGIIGYSLFQTGSQYLIASAQKQSEGGTTLNLNSLNQGTNTAADRLLNAWIDIPDVMTKNPGGHCAVMVIRDLDMRGAYKFRKTFHAGPS